MAKANAILDGITVLIVLFVFAIGGIVAFNIYQDLNTDITNDIDIAPEAQGVSNSLFTRFPEVIDGLFAFSLVLLWILVIAFSFLVDTNPIFFILSIILLLALIFVAAALTEAYQGIVDDAELSVAADNFPISGFVVNNLMTIILAIATTVLIALFAKSRI